MDLFTLLLYIVFVLAAIVLVTVILLQEGKGGGFGDALGVAGQQAFGVKAKGIQSFTGVVAAVWILAGLGIHVSNSRQDSVVPTGDGGSAVESAPGDAGAGGAAPAGDQGGSE